MLANQKRFDDAMAVLEQSERLDPTDINIFLIRSTSIYGRAATRKPRTKLNMH